MSEFIAIQDVKYLGNTNYRKIGGTTFEIVSHYLPEDNERTYESIVKSALSREIENNISRN